MMITYCVVYCAALTAACSDGRTQIVRILLDAGASVTVPNQRGLAPIHCAAHAGHTEVIAALLARAAPLLEHVDRFGRRPLLLAAGEGRDEVLKLLLARGTYCVDPCLFVSICNISNPCQILARHSLARHSLARPSVFILISVIFN